MGPIAVFTRNWHCAKEFRNPHFDKALGERESFSSPVLTMGSWGSRDAVTCSITELLSGRARI